MAESATELETLREELEHFRAEKEKIRDVIGQIGGQGSQKHERVLNIVFLSIVIVLFAVEVIDHMAGWHFLPPALLLSVAVLMVSVKIIWMIHQKAKIDHFQFWILNSIDFQMNMISRRLTALEKKMDQAESGTSGKSGPIVHT